MSTHWRDHGGGFSTAQVPYGKVVAPSGVDGRGYLVIGAETRPNVGQVGMATGFASLDAEGLPSDMQYVALGWHNGARCVLHSRGFAECRGIALRSRRARSCISQCPGR